MVLTVRAAENGGQSPSPATCPERGEGTETATASDRPLLRGRLRPCARQRRSHLKKRTAACRRPPSRARRGRRG
jgi:hypothetical protein